MHLPCSTMRFFLNLSSPERKDSHEIPNPQIKLFLLCAEENPVGLWIFPECHIAIYQKLLIKKYLESGVVEIGNYAYC